MPHSDPVEAVLTAERVILPNMHGSFIVPYSIIWCDTPSRVDEGGEGDGEGEGGEGERDEEGDEAVVGEGDEEMGEGCVSPSIDTDEDEREEEDEEKEGDEEEGEEEAEEDGAVGDNSALRLSSLSLAFETTRQLL